VIDLGDRRLVLVLGKGGVGRSTIAAALAGRNAARGKKTLLFETNANDRFGSYFDKSAVGTTVTELAPNLSAVNTNPAAALEEYGLMILKFKSVYEMVFENRITKAFLRAIPGLDEYSLIGKVWFHEQEEKRGKPVWDTIVFDMPASGHSLSMLRIPWTIVDTVPDGPLTRDARSVQRLLHDRARTSVVVVSLAEEMPANEARELQDKLALLGLAPEQLVVNQVYPNRFPQNSPQAKVLATLCADPSAPPALTAMAAHGQLAASRRALNERYLAQLSHDIKAPLTELPLLFVPRLEPTHVELLSKKLEQAWAP